MGSVIKVENLSKQYRLGDVGTGSLKDDFKRFRHRLMGKEDPFLKVGDVNERTKKSNSDYVWALKDVNFEIGQGDIVGIIGRNGAGKSTLLKILSRTTAPTTGTVKLKGRIASLLEVGTGFHGELSGRENIYLNGTIMGLRKLEIDKKLDEIIDFAGVEKYLDTPVKRYSSGMYVRLAFAVAAHLEPDILIVDEVLAVGDADFQKKCIGKMKDVSDKAGRTVIFVSHNINAIRTLSDRGIVIQNGKVVLDEEVNTAIKYYENQNNNSTFWQGVDGESTISILETKVFNETDSESFQNDSSINITLKIELKETFNDLVIGATIKSIFGYPLATIIYNDFNDYAQLTRGKYLINFLIPPFTLAHGEYQIDFNVSVPFDRKINSDEIGLSFKVTADTIVGNRFFTDDNKTMNSVVRPNWFKSIEKIN